MLTLTGTHCVNNDKINKGKQIPTPSAAKHQNKTSMSSVILRILINSGYMPSHHRKKSTTIELKRSRFIAQKRNINNERPKLPNLIVEVPWMHHA